MTEDKKTLPMIPISNWWALRKKFLQTLPKGQIDKTYLSTLLNIGEPAANNLIPPLKQLGLIDDQNKATDLANKWRHDDTYSEACKAMIDDVYPDGLKDVQPGPIVDKGQAATWISKHLSVGNAAAGKMASLYAVIIEGDPSKETQDAGKSINGESKSKAGKAAASKANPKAKPPTKDVLEQAQIKEPTVPPLDPKLPSFNPTVHLDIQIHISHEMTNEQIDRVFESMAKHLFNRGHGE